MHKAREVADFFLALVDTETGDSISNLKLQKLMYYAQGFHLALTGKPLFEEAIMAWELGPAIPSLYHSFTQTGGEPIPRPDDGVDTSRFTAEEKEILLEVFYEYGQFAPWKLRDFTREEPPWRMAYPTHGEISHESMKRYFSTLVHEQTA